MAETKKIILKGRKVIGGKAEGEALVSQEPLMGWLNVNPQLGCTTERNHPLCGVSFKDKILVFPTPRGSGGFVSYGTTVNYNTNPAAFIYTKGNNLTIFASLVAQIPTVTDLDQDPLEIIETGDYVKVDGDLGIVEVIKSVG
ncbi:MAG: DUF126 domain-containing protein [Firmicutes bacterium]|nr:DUF126 domain-containing protein [Bacillota bacterium]